MKLISMKCPSCSSNLQIENGIDLFYCKYCGCKIILGGQSNAAIKAKVELKKLEQEERVIDKKLAQERYKIDSKRKDENHAIAWCFGVLSVIVLICFIIQLCGNASVKQQHQKLEAVVSEIMIDIQNEDFSAAYIKAASLYWDDSWTSEGEDKWNATRKAIISQINDAEIAKGLEPSYTEEDDKSIWDIFK